jgi:hypothetical protein
MGVYLLIVSLVQPEQAWALLWEGMIASFLSVWPEQGDHPAEPLVVGIHVVEVLLSARCLLKHPRNLQSRRHLVVGPGCLWVLLVAKETLPVLVY